jgi:sugar-specific transcriptional regulator TrmB
LLKTQKSQHQKYIKVLNRLIEKGLVGEFDRGGIKHFSPMDPSTILDYLNEKESKIKDLQAKTKNLLPSLKQMYTEKANEAQVELMRGKQSLWNTWRSMLGELREGDEYRIIGATYGESGNEEEMSFFTEFHKKRVEKGVNARMLFQQSTKPVLATAKTANIRYLPLSFQNPLQINLYKDVSSIVIWGPEPMIFKIHSKQVAEAFDQYFEALWYEAGMKSNQNLKLKKQ